MSNQPDISAPRNPRVKWVNFPEKQALLRRVALVDGRLGLSIVCKNDEAGQAVRQAALAMNFKPITGKPNFLLHMASEKKEFPFTIMELAEKVGGKILDISREEMKENTVYVGMEKPQKAPAENSVTTPAGTVAGGGDQEAERNEWERDEVTPIRGVKIGTNRDGFDVIQAENGRFVKTYVRTRQEKEGDEKAKFLRAETRSDLPVIAYAIFQDAKKRTSLTKTDILQTIRYAMMTGPGGKRPDFTEEEAFDIIRRDLVAQVLEISVEENASRGAWMNASRLATIINNAISEDTAPGEKLSPSLHLMVTMHRLSHGENAVDAMVSPEMRLALPRTDADQAAMSVLDLSEIIEGGRAAYVSNRIARRPDQGRTILLMPGSAENAEFQSLRENLGRFYGIEGATEMSNLVADGTSGAEKWVMVSIGDRRPEPLESVPSAALRVHTSIVQDDLFAFERDVQRSRDKIREFNRGEAELNEARLPQEMVNDHQVPYTAMSRVGESSTMVPYPLQGAMLRAHAKIMRHFEDQGGVDGAVASALGMSISDMAEIFMPEQVDAAAAWMYSRDMEKGFALIDGTGVGKSYSNAAIMLIHLRDKMSRGEDAKGFYLTESVANVKDVLQVMMRTGYKGLRIGIMTTDFSCSIMVDGEQREFKSYTPRERKEIQSSGVFPDSVDVIISTYSMFNRAPTNKKGELVSISGSWIREAFDERVMIVADECHNSIGPGNTGKNITIAKSRVPDWQFLAATATPYKTPREAIFYDHLIPKVAGNAVALLSALPAGREAAQEGLTTQLTEDGSWMRRTRGLSGLTINSVFPDDTEMEFNQKAMNEFSMIAELMVTASAKSRHRSSRIIEARINEMVQEGQSRDVAIKRVKEITNDSDQFGNAVTQLTRMIIVALRCRSIEGGALRDLDEGRKPIISFDQTMMSMFSEMLARGDDVSGLTMRDQILRVLERIYKFQIADEQFDMRDLDPDIATGYQEIRELVAQFPDLPASPIDDLIDKIKAAGYSVGELSGRSFTYSNGEVRQRSKEERDKIATTDKFNSGEYDVLVHNKTGATGVNFQAHEDFLDQRQRSTWIADVFEEVIKMLQGFGRSDRYKQTSSPIINWQMTGLLGEMRLFQQVNRRLRVLGASVDANRNHPMLIESVPDFLNKIGDQAFTEVLRRFPQYATRMGMEYVLPRPQQEGQEQNDEDANITFEGNNVAARAMSRLVVLRDDEQETLIRQVRLEFDAIIEDLDSRNQNPLKPKMLDGKFHVISEDLYSGVEQDPENPTSSSFTAPIYVRTGYVEYQGMDLNGNAIVAMIERSRRLNGAEGFAPWAERLRARIPDLLLRHLSVGTPIEFAMQNPTTQNQFFQNRFRDLNMMATLLENLKPGAEILANLDGDNNGVQKNYIITDLVYPHNVLEVGVPSAYSVVIASPGDSKPRPVSLSKLIKDNGQGFQVYPGLSVNDSQVIRERFDAFAGRMVRKEVQIMHGPLLSVILEAQKKNLGTLSSYHDADTGTIMRGVAVFDKQKDLSLLPVDIRNPEVARGIVATVTQTPEIGKMIDLDERPKAFNIIGMMSDSTRNQYTLDDPDIRIVVQRTQIHFDLQPPRVGNHAFYALRPGLHEALFQEPLPDRENVGSRRKGQSKQHAGYVIIKLDSPENVERVKTAMQLMFEMKDGQNANLHCSGRGRAIINQISRSITDDLVQEIEEAEIVEMIPANEPAIEMDLNGDGEIAWGDGDLSLDDDPETDDTDIEWEVRA